MTTKFEMAILVAFAGSVASGFSADASLTAALAPELSELPPLPSDCAF